MAPFKIALAVAAGLSLASCQTLTAFDPRGCPVERKYSKAEQARFLRDLPRTPKSIRDAFLIDYYQLRLKARACRGET